MRPQNRSLLGGVALLALALLAWFTVRGSSARGPVDATAPAPAPLTPPVEPHPEVADVPSRRTEVPGSAPLAVEGTVATSVADASPTETATLVRGRVLDPGGRGLTKHFREPNDGDCAGVDQIGQKLARPDRGQLVHIADEYHRGPVGDRPEQLIGERHVNH